MKAAKIVFTLIFLSFLLAACQNEAAPTATAVPPTAAPEEEATEVEVVPMDTAVPTTEPKETTETPAVTSSGELPALPMVDTFEGYDLQSGTADFASIKDYVAFYPSRMQACFVDGEQVQAQPGDFYGGWITSDIVGPFKGSVGTWGW